MVVRCKDCRYFDTDTLPKESYHDGICRNYDKGIKGWFPKKDDFCSGGERRKDNMNGHRLFCEEVKILTKIASDRFLTEYRQIPTTVIVPAGTIGLLKMECSENMTYPDEETVRFCGLLFIESPRIKDFEEIEVY